MSDVPMPDEAVIGEEHAGAFSAKDLGKIPIENAPESLPGPIEHNQSMRAALSPEDQQKMMEMALGQLKEASTPDGPEVGVASDAPNPHRDEIAKQLSSLREANMQSADKTPFRIGDFFSQLKLGKAFDVIKKAAQVPGKVASFLGNAFMRFWNNVPGNDTQLPQIRTPLGPPQAA